MQILMASPPGGNEVLVPFPGALYPSDKNTSAKLEPDFLFCYAIALLHARPRVHVPTAAMEIPGRQTFLGSFANAQFEGMPRCRGLA